MEFSPPQIDNVIPRLESFSMWIDQNMYGKLEAIYQEMNSILPEGDDQVRSLWLEVPRGSIEDFGDYKEFREEGLVESPTEFRRYWLEVYPENYKWYRFTTAQYQKEKFFYIDSRLIISIDKAEAIEETKVEAEESIKSEMYDCSSIYDFLDWLLLKVRTETTKLAKDSKGYNDYLEKNLSHHQRTGRLQRSKYWKILGNDAIILNERLGQSRISTLRTLVKEQEQHEGSVIIKEMSAADFFTYCEICFNANDYFSEIELNLSPIEKYRNMADGRDGGLCSLELNSKSAFHKWYHSGDRIGAHPWEICRGGNSTHISLMVSEAKEGWALWLAGSSIVRVEETTRMAVALYERNIPFNLHQGEAILRMVTGNDYIGIVPDYVVPRYCSGLFPKEDRIIDFMNLGYENSEKLIDGSYWYPLKKITV